MSARLVDSVFVRKAISSSALQGPQKLEAAQRPEEADKRMLRFVHASLLVLEFFSSFADYVGCLWDPFRFFFCQCIV